MEVNAVSLDVNKIKEVLGCIEQLLGVGVFILVGDGVVDHHVDAFVAVELRDLLHVDSSLLDVKGIHDI